jgi:hypothetical protein
MRTNNPNCHKDGSVKGERPDKFKDRTENTGPNGGPSQLSAIPANGIDRELKKLEQPNSGDNK